MKIKHLIALTALALGLAAGGVGASGVASIRGGSSGDFRAVAASKPTNSGDAPAIAGGGVRTGDPLASIKGGMSGDFGTEAGGPAIAGGGVRGGDISF